MRTFILVQIFVEGFHLYPDAPNEVDFLKFNHRHTFKITCCFGVTHQNRQKEIFIYADKIKKLLHDKYQTPCDFKEMSCEMIALFIMQNFEQHHIQWCEVWEEKTGGARVEK